ncbi:tyrosine-type recombinase/integrase [Polaromonas sp. JS666]|uniref:tyrosine-type recombinase/integrase n=1 Tax=Polaromonas sp. (strain JS666 / ATCC BAA-500) TaxID=296591 RepID=UPI0018DD55C4|nr:tyrosine-type recombinase/integrase [Polaromonas sp. JS666]
MSTLQSMFAWLVNAGYLASNPWVLVSRRLDDAPLVLPTSRSIPRVAWDAIIDYLVGAGPQPSAVRMLFVLRFALATGLRPAELIAAQLGHLADAGESGVVLSVVGKGGKARLVPVPGVALAALDAYLAARGLVRGNQERKRCRWWPRRLIPARRCLTGCFCARSSRWSAGRLMRPACPKMCSSGSGRRPCTG